MFCHQKFCAALALPMAVCVGSAYANFEVDQFNTNNSFSDPSFKTVNFRQTFEREPVVFVLSTTQGGDSGMIRIQNVTTTGFEAIVAESPGEDGPHVAMTDVTYLAIEPGLYEIEPGVFLDAGVRDTTSVVTGPLAFGGNGAFEEVEFRQDFGSSPAVLSTIQTMNNETGGVPANPSQPFLAPAVDSIGVQDFDIALDRMEATGGAVVVDETIGYLALQDTTGSFLDNQSNTIDWEAFLSSDSIVGFGNPVTVGFNNTYSSTPLAVASKATRDGTNGGWLRRDSVNSTGIGLVVDEDVSFDAERNHTTEQAAVAAFSQAFDATLSRQAINIFWLGLASSGGWDENFNWFRWDGNDRNLQDGDQLLFTNLGATTTTTSVNENYTAELGGIVFSGSTAYTINGGGGSLNLEDGGSVSNSSSVIQTLDVDLTAHGSTVTVDAGVTPGGGLVFGSNGTIDLSDSGGVGLTVTGSNNTTINGAIVGPGGSLTKDGNGTLTLGGSTSNTFTGTTTLNDGTVGLTKSAGALAISGNIVVNGGTLLLGGDEQIADLSAMDLGGGVFETADFDETLGMLTLSSSSEIDRSGNSTLQFADSSSAGWAGGQLTINNYDGDFDQLFFGSTAGGLTSTQVGQIKFFNPAGFAPGIYDAEILASGEVVPVPVPESSTYIVGGILALGCAGWEWRRRRKCRLTAAKTARKAGR